ncbi:hypothetical protein K469DRAFT_716254 [Zopfia rhizophila CBS 207.26]|uniref:SGNH hydrolase n=1 Tax=Zopfia rhizophila CBS 207.26 TaxID=1314779 RepID=A0A6A6DK08_9PEZI|nr:hypothetical protein K469DRAFT_716254 [Zopfia rhizophila CBS 207.26]
MEFPAAFPLSQAENVVRSCRPEAMNFQRQNHKPYISPPVMSSSSLGKINCSHFYAEWKGHPIEDLKTFHTFILQQRPDKPIIYLAGDSSLDNKYWVPSSGASGEPLPVEVPEIYWNILNRPRPKPDIAFWLNHSLGNEATALNTAVEESMLRERDEYLLPHDKFIRDHIRPEDILIVSIGANDVALRPTLSTIRHMLQLAWLTPKKYLESGTASSLKYFKNMFGDRVQSYIERLIEKQKPRAVIVCAIYYPLEANAGQRSWADLQLKALGYNSYPSQLRMAIRKMYEIATQKIQIEGTTVVPCALYAVLDGKRKQDYTARVEPSSEGGRKMAAHFQELLDPFLR